jgi:hypothetical protein
LLVCSWSPDLYLTARDFSQRRCPAQVVLSQQWICCPVSVCTSGFLAAGLGISRSARLCSFLPI